MTGSYTFWAVLGMAGYSLTTLLVKLATRAGLPSSAVLAIATAPVLIACWSIVIARGQTGMIVNSLTQASGAWALAAGVALAVAVTSLFRALELGPASVVVPIYGMFILGGFLLGVLILGEALTPTKAVGIAAAVLGVYLIAS